MADILGQLGVAAAPASIIELSPPSAAFIAARATTLGSWVIAGTFDCVLMGIVFTQIAHHTQNQLREGWKWDPQQFLVIFVSFLAVLKTIQSIAIIWGQNVEPFADPDRARLLVSTAWWQVSTTIMTGITGALVQSFYAWRFYRLSRSWPVAVVIYIAIALSLAGACLSTFFIVKAEVKPKVMWLTIHFVAAFVADAIITTGTVWALRSRSTGLPTSKSLVSRLLRMIFEAAVPPALFATLDLILTQTLGSKLLWHLVVNYALAKLYVISFLYTINSIGDYRAEKSITDSTKISLNNTASRRPVGRGDIELSRVAQIQVQTHVSTQITPSGYERGVISSDSGLDTKEDDYHQVHRSPSSPVFAQ